MKNRDKYPPHWEDTIRPLILLRDKYTCQKCGVRHRKCYVFQKDGTRFEIPEDEISEWRAYGDKAYKVHLQVAHLDQNPSNNDDDNLKAMCPKCHLAFDRAYNKLKRISKLK